MTCEWLVTAGHIPLFFVCTRCAAMARPCPSPRGHTNAAMRNAADGALPGPTRAGGRGPRGPAPFSETVARSPRRAYTAARDLPRGGWGMPPPGTAQSQEVSMRLTFPLGGVAILLAAALLSGCARQPDGPRDSIPETSAHGTLPPPRAQEPVPEPPTLAGVPHGGQPDGMTGDPGGMQSGGQGLNPVGGVPRNAAGSDRRRGQSAIMGGSPPRPRDAFRQGVGAPRLDSASRPGERVGSPRMRGASEAGGHGTASRVDTMPRPGGVHGGVPRMKSAPGPAAHGGAPRMHGASAPGGHGGAPRMRDARTSRDGGGGASRASRPGPPTLKGAGGG